MRAEIRHVLGGLGPGRNMSAAALARKVYQSRCIGAVVRSASADPSPLPRSPHGDAINRTWPDLSWRARFAMCSATTARGKVGSLRSQDIPWIDAGSARGALCGCCNPAPGRAALLPCHFSAALQHQLFKLKIWSAARFSGPGWALHPGARPTASHMGPIER